MMRAKLQKRNSKPTIEPLARRHFPTFLNACHAYLSLGLNVPKDMTKSTQGNASNANLKLRLYKIRAWSGFAQEQAAIGES